MQDTKKTIDPFDELAAMFLTSSPVEPIQARIPPPFQQGGSEARPPHPPMHSSTSDEMLHRPAKGARAPITELLIAGHLPVRGGLWLTPYADAVARQVGSTALLRLDTEEPSLQLLRAPVDLASSPLDLTMQRSIEMLEGAVDFWMIRPAASTAWVDLISSKADRITILSSADEAAVVAAYQFVKELSEAAGQAQIPVPQLGLAVIGADAATAAAVVDRLNRTTVSFLGVEVKLTMFLPRMDAGVRSTRYVSFGGQLPPSLTDVMTWIERTKAATARRPVQHTAVAGQLYADRQETGMTDAQRILEMTAPSPPRARVKRASPPVHSAEVDSAAASAPAPQPVTLGPRVKLFPKPMIDVEPKEPGRALEPDDHGKPVALATHIAGLTLLAVRSPGHERVELAVDSAGRLNLLARDLAAGALREMRIVECWAKAHRELIGMACPQQSIDQRAKPIWHVFSDEPVALADLHGTDVRLHVLAAVVIGGQTGWYCAPLNVAAR